MVDARPLGAVDPRALRLGAVVLPPAPLPARLLLLLLLLLLLVVLGWRGRGLGGRLRLPSCGVERVGATVGRRPSGVRLLEQVAAAPFAVGGGRLGLGVGRGWGRRVPLLGPLLLVSLLLLLLVLVVVLLVLLWRGRRAR